MGEPVRLARRVAAQAGCSRRDAELYIEGGWVSVDGVVVHEPQERVDDAQHVAIDPAADVQALRPLTLLLHQPAGADGAQARALLVPANATPPLESAPNRRLAHLAALWPLPPFASGLAVFSQEHGVVRRLTEDAALVEQELVAQVEGRMADGGLERLAHGLVFEGRALPRLKASWQSEQRLRLAGKGIAPELVPWMCEQVSLRLTALKRLRIGRVPLAGLAEGRWRALRAGERF